jgi:hydantoinase/carbamoylase family amidase
MSSSTIAGSIDASVLELTDAAGVTMAAALAEFGGDPEHLLAEAYRRPDVVGYIEVHIEQGPVLDQAGEPLGVVTAIASQGRYRVHVRGEAGHAGTVPMAIRHDALAGAAEMIEAVETVASGNPRHSLVATVGQLRVQPGASNVIPGFVEFSVDVRAGDDIARTEAAGEIRQRLWQIGLKRGLVVGVETVHEKPVAVCAPMMRQAIAKAVRSLTGTTPRELVSGAGHDGQAMSHLTGIGMMFVRCRGGISHSPFEFVSVDDMGLAVEALVGTVAEIGREEG